jgi:hypothetical protein
MRILLLGRRGHDHAVAANRLRAAGHEVVSCFSGDARWACNALDGPCPLDTHTDVVVAARQPGPERYDSQGAVCARRRRIPLIAIGAEREDDIRAVATAIVAEPDEELVAACADLGAGPSPAHTAAARRAIADWVAPSERVEVSVTRTADGLHAELTTTVDEPVHDRTLIERVRAGLSRFDPLASRVTISIRHAEPA